MTVCSGIAEICSRNMLQKFFSQKFVALQQNLLQKFVGLWQKFVLQQPKKFAAAICIAEILCRNLLDCSRNLYCSNPTNFCRNLLQKFVRKTEIFIAAEICCRNQTNFCRNLLQKFVGRNLQKVWFIKYFVVCLKSICQKI